MAKGAQPVTVDASIETVLDRNVRLMTELKVCENALLTHKRAPALMRDFLDKRLGEVTGGQADHAGRDPSTTKKIKDFTAALKNLDRGDSAIEVYGQLVTREKALFFGHVAKLVDGAAKTRGDIVSATASISDPAAREAILGVALDRAHSTLATMTAEARDLLASAKTLQADWREISQLSSAEQQRYSALWAGHKDLAGHLLKTRGGRIHFSDREDVVAQMFLVGGDAIRSYTFGAGTRVDTHIGNYMTYVLKEYRHETIVPTTDFNDAEQKIIDRLNQQRAVNGNARLPDRVEVAALLGVPEKRAGAILTGLVDKLRAANITEVDGVGREDKGDRPLALTAKGPSPLELAGRAEESSTMQTLIGALRRSANTLTTGTLTNDGAIAGLRGLAAYLDSGQDPFQLGGEDLAGWLKSIIRSDERFAGKSKRQIAANANVRALEALQPELAKFD